jgi:hypothetical protein
MKSFYTSPNGLIIFNIFLLLIRCLSSLYSKQRRTKKYEYKYIRKILIDVRWFRKNGHLIDKKSLKNSTLLGFLRMFL